VPDAAKGNHKMKILDLLHKDAILPDLASKDKKGAIEELAAPIVQLTGVDQTELVDVLMARERLGTTGIGGGIGIPHGKLSGLDSLQISFGLSKKGINFDSMDGKPTHIFFLLITPENSTGLHLKLLAQISKILKNDPFKEKLMNATGADDLYRIIEEEDEEF